MCIKDKIENMKALRLERSFDARLAIAKKGDCYPIKSLSMHRSCSTPLWKIILLMLGITAGLMTLCCIMKKCSCDKSDTEC